MDPILIAGIVVVFVQGIKEALKKLNINLTGPLALFTTVLVAAGETWNVLPELSFNTGWFFLKVVVYALGGYGLIKVASGKPTI